MTDDHPCSFCSFCYLLTDCYTCSAAHKPRTTLSSPSISPAPKDIHADGSPEINFCINARFFTYAPNVRFDAGRMTRWIASWLAGIAAVERLCVGEPMAGSEAGL